MISEFILGIATSLTANAIQRKLEGTPSFFQRKKLDAKVDEIVIAVVEPLSIFFETEGLSFKDVEILTNGVKPVVEWLIENPEFCTVRGLVSENIVEDIIREKNKFPSLLVTFEHPAALETMLRAMVDLVVKVPPIFREWERASFQAIFKQTEDIKILLSSLYTTTNMQEIKSAQIVPVGTLEKIINHKATSSALTMHINGLRQSPVPQAEADNLFVFPSIKDGSSAASLPYVEDPELEEQSARHFEKCEEFLNYIFEGFDCALVAPAGAGKTTFSNWIASQVVKGKYGVFPVVLSLRKILKMGELPGLFDIFSSYVSSVFRDLVRKEDVSLWADLGRVMLIFDGFDEVPEACRDDVKSWMLALKLAHPKLKMLLTSRPLSTDHIECLRKQDWGYLTIEPFDQNRVVQYITRFQEHGPEIQTGAALQTPVDLAEAWNRDPTLGPLTGNPLLLSTLLMVHHMDGELPDDRSKLYERYVDGMLGLWELNKDLSPPQVPLTKEQKKEILELIAVNMISQEIDAVSEEEVSSWIKQYLVEQRIPNDVKGILDHLRERSGLLVGPGQYTFAHKSIGEFLVAQACNDGVRKDFSGRRFDRMHLMEKCGQDRWNTVVFLWVGLASKSDAQEFISKLLDEGKIKLTMSLLLERRKFLERDWVEETFWRWTLKATSPNGWLSIKTAHGFAGPGPTESTSVEVEEVCLHSLQNLSGGGVFERDFLSYFFSEGFCDPNDWEERGLVFTPALWWSFLNFVNITDKFIEAAPQVYSTGVVEFLLARQTIYGLPGREVLSQGREDFGGAKKEYCLICFLYAYCQYKSTLNSFDRPNETDLKRELWYVDLRRKSVQEWAQSSVLEKLKMVPFQDFSGELINVLSEDFIDSADFSRNIKGTFLQVLEKSIAIKDCEDPICDVERYVTEIFVNASRAHLLVES